MSVTVNYEADEQQKSEDTVNGGTPRRARLPGGGRTVWGAGRPGGAGAPQVRDAPRGNWMEEARPTHLENSEGLCTAEGGPGNARLWLVTMCPCWFFHCARRAPMGEETRGDCAGGKGSSALPALCLQI